ncbi:hypothetical protein A5699_21530 [Mycobacterium sp. E802]|uniref:hypothetical protein n=1 Tax=Mycobacterium sp. E802 TaxID=1834152 RepID=UPI0007FB9961|nr:hypothetical protein [Mycobacterium sp. E802]OBG86498.1 hypothetical protein A5699_21530 [Mycobacterium sp. E802]
MTVALTEITDADVGEVAEFLRTNHNHRVPWTASCSTMPWKVQAPNRGFMLRDGHRVVGTLLALYSERMIAGRLERFCNMSSWCVLPDYRSRSILLLKALLAQDDYHFTVLSPDEGPQEILAWHKFRFLDTSAAFIPNLPWPTIPGRTKVSADPAVLERTLAGTELQIYRDHAHALAAHHVVLTRGRESCYVMYREFRRRGLPLFAIILYVSDPELFHRMLIPLTRHLLVRRGLVATLAEQRIIERNPLLSLRLTNWAKMYRSTSLGAEQIDYLYSELVCVPW